MRSGHCTGGGSQDLMNAAPGRATGRPSRAWRSPPIRRHNGCPRVRPTSSIEVGTGRASFSINLLRVGDLPGLVMGRAILEPGLAMVIRMSRSIAGRDSCQAAHADSVVSGRMHVRMDEGSELDLALGDALWWARGTMAGWSEPIHPRCRVSPAAKRLPQARPCPSL